MRAGSLFELWKEYRSFPGGAVGKGSACECRETWARSLSQEDPLEEQMANELHYSCLKIPRTEEPGVLQSMGSQESDMTECAHSQGIQEGDEASGAGRAGT